MPPDCHKSRARKTSKMQKQRKKCQIVLDTLGQFEFCYSRKGQKETGAGRKKGEKGGKREKSVLSFYFQDMRCIKYFKPSWPGFISSSWSNPQMWNPSYWHLTGRWSQLLYWILSSPFTTSSQLIAGVLALLLITAFKSSNFASEVNIWFNWLWSHLPRPREIFCGLSV